MLFFALLLAGTPTRDGGDPAPGGDRLPHEDCAVKLPTLVAHRVFGPGTASSRVLRPAPERASARPSCAAARTRRAPRAAPRAAAKHAPSSTARTTSARLDLRRPASTWGPAQAGRGREALRDDKHDRRGPCRAARPGPPPSGAPRPIRAAHRSRLRAAAREDPPRRGPSGGEEVSEDWLRAPTKRPSTRGLETELEQVRAHRDKKLLAPHPRLARGRGRAARPRRRAAARRGRAPIPRRGAGARSRPPARWPSPRACEADRQRVADRVRTAAVTQAIVATPRPAARFPRRRSAEPADPTPYKPGGPVRAPTADPGALRVAARAPDFALTRGRAPSTGARARAPPRLLGGRA